MTRDTLRMFKSEVQKFEIDNQETADDAKALQIINKMIKQRKDSIAQFTEGGRVDLAEKEQLEVTILSKYKPQQLNESEITEKVQSAISESGASTMQDIGKVMGILKNSIAPGTADMGVVSKIVKDQLKNFIKYVPIVFIISLLFLSKFKVADNFQGRTVGVEQVALNFTSIFSTSEEGGLNDNKIWRLLWWGQIIDYTFNGPFFIAGKGLGISLADDDQILTTYLEGDLRSPHNYSLSVLARYGVFIFFIWLYWNILQIKRIKTSNITKLQLVIICIQIAFLFNANFDVFLEGPMGAFPFWVFVGIDLIFNYFKLYNTSLEHDLFKIPIEKSV